MQNVTENYEMVEVEKVKRRVPGWYKKPWQMNATLLINYINLSLQFPIVTKKMLKKRCPDIFYGNFSQMVNFGEKNHGKVFELKYNEVLLWSPVKTYILDEYQKALPKIIQFGKNNCLPSKR